MKRKPKSSLVILQLDEREMVFQRVLMQRPTGQITGEFYLCRFFGSRDCWIQTKVLSPHVLTHLQATPLAYREAEVDQDQIIQIVSVDWLLENFKSDPASREFLEGIATVFDHDNSNGQMVGKCFYRNPTNWPKE